MGQSLGKLHNYSGPNILRTPHTAPKNENPQDHVHEN